MARTMRGIKVKEVMSRNPARVSGEISVMEGAKLLKKRKISTLVIEEDGKPIGIVTDRDFIVKVIAEGVDIKKTKLKEIMSSPVVMISSEEKLEDAAKIMSKRRIRKLPVMENEDIVGILSENDIVRISPDLIALAQEYAHLHTNSDYKNHTPEYIAGRCEMCGQYSLRLRKYNGMLVCPECFDSMR